MYNQTEIHHMDLNSNPPTKEPARQQYFMEQLRTVVEKKSREYGRPLTACIKTFGCPKV